MTRDDRSPTNHLAGETSPYLLQHAHNPVDWYPWGRTALDRGRQDVRRLAGQLQALSPEAVLTRGYSLTSTEDGEVVNRAAGLAPGQRLITRLARGTIASRVETATEDNDDGDQG